MLDKASRIIVKYREGMLSLEKAVAILAQSLVSTKELKKQIQILKDIKKK